MFAVLIGGAGRSGLGALLLVAALSPGCGRPLETRVRVEHAILEHKVERLEELLASTRNGRLVPFDQGLIVIDQALLGKLLTAGLPYETLVGGQFRIRVLKATVSCDDGMALVRLDGRASFANQPEAGAFAEATVYGALRDFELKPEAGLLRGRVSVVTFETRRVNVLGNDDESVEGLLQDLGELRLEAFQGADYVFDLPVRLVHDVVLPEVGPEGGVRIPEATIPLSVSVVDVKALSGKLWISLHLYDDPVSNDPVAPSVSKAGGRAP
ncbi:MAG: hypothetical protein ABIS67_00945 [Candidatus Eisenbacteria bacterium]